MLFYMTDSHLSDCSEALLAELPDNVPVLLTQNAVYLYSRLRAAYPSLRLHQLVEDTQSRGLDVDENTAWTLSDWTSMSTTHHPWILLK
ncbi:hypothetical protein [Alteromonas sp. CYL-A6]|uniref:hypothetical protein n=1 Tax=Alteromonas nitratireducens TaxID=3390813 RepID=UPI0034B4A892